MPDMKLQPLLRTLLLMAAVAAGILLGIRFLLPLILPFLLALLLGRLLEPFVRLLTRRFRLPRPLASLLGTLLLVSGLFSGIFLLIRRLIRELSSLTERLPELATGLDSFFSRAEESFYSFLVSLPPDLGVFLANTLEQSLSRGIALPASLTEQALGTLTSALAQVPATLLFLFTAILATYLVSSNYPKLAQGCLSRLPSHWQDRVRKAWRQFASTIGKWLRAQLMLMGITFLELAVGFLLLRVEYALTLAILVAIIDALPILGTGTILLPWALLSLLRGNPELALALLMLYLVITLIRRIIEPKLVGSQLGLSPLMTLVAIYVGFRLFGIWGMILFPLLFIFLKQLYDFGYFQFAKEK